MDLNQGIADAQDIGFLTPDVRQQQAGAVPSKVRMENGQPQGLRAGREGSKDAEEKRRDQAAAKAFPSLSAKRRRLARIMRATRAMAVPRITRLAGI